MDSIDTVFDAINSHSSVYVKQVRDYTSRIFDTIFPKTVSNKEPVLLNKALNDSDFLAAKPAGLSRTSVGKKIES